MTEQWWRMTADLTTEQADRLGRDLTEAARHAQLVIDEYERVMSKAGCELAVGVEKYLQAKGQ